MSEESLKEIASILKEILKWTKFAGSNEVKKVLTDALDSDQKILLYHLSDGNKGTVAIGQEVGVSNATVAKYWKAWARMGIVETIRVQGGERSKKVFDLEDFGINVPEIEVKKRRKTN